MIFLETALFSDILQNITETREQIFKLQEVLTDFPSQIHTLKKIFSYKGKTNLNNRGGEIEKKREKENKPSFSMENKTKVSIPTLIIIGRTN